MRTVRFVYTLLVFGAFSSIGFSQKSIGLNYPTYSLKAYSQPYSEDESKLTPFIIARQRTPTGKELHPFGILYRTMTSDSQNIFEIIDADKNKSIKKISVSEYYGVETANWKPVIAETITSEEKLLSVFRIQNGVYNLKIIFESTILKAPNLPLGKIMNIELKAESDIPIKIGVKFFGSAEGIWKSAGKSFFISDNDTLSKFHSTLVFHLLKENTIEAAGPIKKNYPRNFTVSSKAVAVTPNILTTLFGFEVTGTTISFGEYINLQVNNIQSYLNTRIGKPSMISVSQSSKPSSQPGDTLTFFLYSHNIGTDVAIENTLNNMIPSGTTYLEGSAEGAGSNMIITRSEAIPPQVGSVSNITWKYQDPIYPGEERKASFKVIVR
jgi:uncharacterized repeat protein (TIGR01451 family)